MSSFFTQTTNASPGFSGFGANAPKPTTGFGAPTNTTPFGSSSNTTQPAFGQFQTQPITNPATTQPSTGFGGFMSQPTQPVNAFQTHATQSSAFGSSFGSTLGGNAPSAFGSFGMQTQQLQSQPELNFPLGADTPFKSLPSHIQSAIIDAYKNYKKPVHDALALMSRVEDRKIDELDASIQCLRLSTLRLVHKFETLVQGVNDLQDQIKYLSKDFYGFCEIGTLELKKRGYSSIGTSAPDLKLLYPMIEQLYDQLLLCSSKIQQLGYHYTSMKSNVVKDSRGRGSYGQRITIGAQQLFQLIQHQNDSLFSIANSLSNVHRETEELRRKYLSILDTSSKRHERPSNPFMEAEERMQSEKRRLMQKLRADVQEVVRNNPLPSNPPTGNTSAGMSFGGLTGSSLTGNALTFNPSAGSTSTSAATPGGIPPATGFGFGSALGQSSALPLNRTATIGGFATPGGTLNALDLAKPTGGLQDANLSAAAANQRKLRSRR